MRAGEKYARYIEGMKPTAGFIDLAGLAGALNLPTAWVRSEALAGRIPCFRAGRRLWFDVEQVRATLLDRANENANQQVEVFNGR